MTAPVRMNIQSMGVQQNLSEQDITSGEVRGQVEPTATIPPMKQSTWTFRHSVPGKSDILTHDLMPYEWLIFKQTNPLLKLWRLVLTTRPVTETTLGEAHGRVEQTEPVPPRMEPETWNFDNYNTSYKQSNTDPLLKNWRPVIVTRPVMMKIQSVGAQQNLSEPDITPGEVRGQVDPTDTVPPMKTPEIKDTMEHNHQENEQQIAKTGAAVNSADQMRIKEKESNIKVVRLDPLELDFM